jgi:hypothetical protein
MHPASASLKFKKSNILHASSLLVEEVKGSLIPI